MNEGIRLADWLEQSSRAIGIVFTDIVGSTLLVHRQKTANYALILRDHRAHAEQVAASHDGQLIVNVGDEILAAFQTATGAYRFAFDLFQDAGHPQLSIRAGVHFGTVQAIGTGLVGRNLHIGARVMGHGRDHELWVSDAAKEALESESQAVASQIAWVAHEDCELKGVPGLQRLWRAA